MTVLIAERPAFDRLCRAVTRREIDVVVAWSVDRLGRSLGDLVSFLGELQGAGADLYLHHQGLDTSTPAGRAMFGMLGVFAEFERAIIRERVIAGIGRARAAGKHLGRPRLADDKRDAVRDLLGQGVSIRRAALAVDVGLGTVARIAAELRASG